METHSTLMCRCQAVVMKRAEDWHINLRTNIEKHERTAQSLLCWMVVLSLSTVN